MNDNRATSLDDNHNLLIITVLTEMSKWEKKLDRVFERVLEDSEGEVSVLKTTSDSDFSEGTLSSKDCARADAERIQAHEERKVYMEMCALLDNTLHLTVDTILNNGDGRGHGDGDTDTPAKEFTIRKDSTELPYHHDRGTTLSSLALIDVEGIDEEGDTIPLSSSSSSPSSTSSLMSISAVELCLLKVFSQTDQCILSWKCSLIFCRHHVYCLYVCMLCTLYRGNSRTCKRRMIDSKRIMSNFISC